VYIYVYKSVGTYSVCVYLYMGVYMCIFVYVCLRVHVIACYSVANPLMRSNGNRRPKPDLNLCLLWTDTLAIRRPINGMIRRSVPVHAMKTRWRFGSKTASFHVNICSSIISLFIIASRCSCNYSYHFCDHMIYFTSMITCITS